MKQTHKKILIIIILIIIIVASVFIVKSHITWLNKIKNGEINFSEEFGTMMDYGVERYPIPNITNTTIKLI